METYRWHAKRFTMETKWGTKFPWRVNDKGGRAIFRRFARHAVISDLSYFSCLCIDIESASDLQLVPEQIRTQVSSLVQISAFRRGDVRVVDLLRDPSSGEILTPAVFVMIGNCLLIHTHPCFKFQQELSASASFCLFELRGPKSVEFAAKALQTDIANYEAPINCLMYGSETVRVFRTSQGCDIHVLRSAAKMLFISLVFAGASAIGYADRSALFAEFQVAQFPDDFQPHSSTNLWARLRVKSGRFKSGDTVHDAASGACLGELVRVSFSFRLGTMAGLVRLNASMSHKQLAVVAAPARVGEGLLEQVEWLMAEDPSFGLL